MIKNDSLRASFDKPYAVKFLSTDVKRVIVPLPKGIKGQDVDYTEWDGSAARGNGFLFYNKTDERGQFISSDGGIFIGHEGECPEGDDGEMIMRSEAVERYLNAHPDALSPEHMDETVHYLQNKVFKHAVNDPTKWDDNGEPDIWTSNTKWLEKNFKPEDIYDSNGNIRSVISAAKKSEAEYDAVYLGPNAIVEGIGETGDRGSWAIRKPDGSVNLCVEEVFAKTYKRTDFKRTMRYMEDDDPYMPKKAKITTQDWVRTHRERGAQMETPVYRVVGAAICDYLQENPDNALHLQLAFNSLLATDANELSIIKDNPKSNILRPLLEERIVNEKGAIINPEKFAHSEFLKDFRGLGVDLSQTKTIRNLAHHKSMVNTKSAHR